MALTSEINIRLAPEDYQRIEARARGAGLTCAEFVRPVVLRALAPDPIETIMIAEVWATQALLLVLVGMQARGEPITDAILRAEKTAIDAEKLAEARHLLTRTTESR